jgi:DNA repair protein SbcD/Mre11
MALKILHTADLHLGLKFSGYPDVQSELSEARFEVLDRLICKANSEKCDLFVLAGDFFDRVTIAKRDISRCVDILNEFDGLVVVLPGNHDYISSQSELWDYFVAHIGDRVIVLDKKEPFSLDHYDLDVTLYPGPCTAKHSSENAVGWVETVHKDPNTKYHIGVAHGNIEGLGIDERQNYYPMTRAELLGYGLDLWLLGHIHVPFPTGETSSERIYYSGTPEPDGFDCRHSGYAWLIELDDEKRINGQRISTGKYQFTHDEHEVRTSEDLAKLKKHYTDTDRTNMLVKLKLTGRLPRETYAELETIKSLISDHVLYLQWDDNDVAIEITIDVIDQEFTQDSFPHKLLAALASNLEDAEALQIGYEMIQEVKE